MSTYVIGDVHGCYETLIALLERCRFDAHHDHVVFVGDIVNRGPGSLEALRLVKNYGSSATLVLGNHDMHLLAIQSGARRNKSPALTELLAASDCEELCGWLRQQPLLHTEGSFTIVHAGIYPQWDLAEAKLRAHEVEALIRSDQCQGVFEAMYDATPGTWCPQLPAFERASQILKFFTRLRVCTLEGSAVDSVVVAPEELPADQVPWFQVEGRATRNDRILFGHWATLGFRQEANVISLDTGAGWGRFLSAYRIDDGVLIQQPRLEPVDAE